MSITEPVVLLHHDHEKKVLFPANLGAGIVRTLITALLQATSFILIQY